MWGTFLQYGHHQGSVYGANMEMCGDGVGGGGLEMVGVNGVHVCVMCLSNILTQASIPDTFSHYIVQYIKLESEFGRFQ